MKHITINAPYPRSRVMKAILFLSLVLFLFIPVVSKAETEGILDLQRVDSLQRRITQTEGKEKLDLYKDLTDYIQYAGSYDLISSVFHQYIEEAKKQKEYKTAAYAYSKSLQLLRLPELHNHNLKHLEKIYREALNFTREHEFWDAYFSLTYFMEDAYAAGTQSDVRYQLIEEMYKEAKDMDNAYGKGMAAARMARFHDERGQYEEAEKYILEAIADLEMEEPEEELFYILLNTYRHAVHLSMYLEKVDQAKTYFDKLKKLVEHDGSNYIGIYMLNEASFQYYYQQGNLEDAEMALKRIQEIFPYLRIINKIKYYSFYLLIYYERGDMNRALLCAEKVIDLGKISNQPKIFARGMKVKRAILESQKRYREALASYDEYVQVIDSIRNAETELKFIELRTIYEVDQLTAEKEIGRQQLIIAVGGCILLLIILIIYIIYSRRLRQKNLNLYNQVQELNRKEKAAEQYLLARPDETLSKELQLFRKLSKLMREEKYFTDPELNRKKLADILGTNEAYLADAIKSGSGETYSGYLADLRLQYALEMLNNNSELTFEAIAIDSGHGSYSQFFRSFSKKYGINPSEYRKMSARKKTDNKESASA